MNMNNEETVLDPQYSAESKVNAENNTASNDTKKSKGNGIAGKVGAATVGVAAGVAGTMYADDLKAAVLPNSDDQTENSSEEQPTSEPVSTSNQEPTSANHTNPHATPTSNQSSNHEPNQNHTVEVVDVAQEDVNGDGQLDDAALLNVDGEAMVIADIDHDGEADVLMRDVNGNGQVDKEDILDVRAEHIAMPNHAEATQTSLPDDGDVEVHVLHVGQADLNGDGLAENVAVVDVEGNEVLLVDIDQDNTADVLIRNENGTNNAYDITDEDIDMPTMSDGDMYMASADSEPDYTNDADIDLFDA